MLKVLIATTMVFCAISCATEKFVHSDLGLKYMVLKKGKGEIAKVGNEVLIHETMSYPNDSLIFSSYNLSSPIKFLIGANQVIDGIDEGVRGMKKGEMRKLIVPPSLSKRMGNQTFPHPDSTLIYTVELIDIVTKLSADTFCYWTASRHGLVATPAVTVEMRAYPAEMTPD